MTKLKLNIRKMNCYMTQRETILTLLSKYDKYLSLEFESIKTPELYNDIKILISDLRICSINIITFFKNIRKRISNDLRNGKFNDEEKLLNRKYLYKMRYDINFISKGVIGKLFHLSEDSDTFFSSGKMDIPYNDEISKLITKCQYFLINQNIEFHIKNKVNIKNIKANEINTTENNVNDKENNMNLYNKVENAYNDKIQMQSNRSNHNQKEINQHKKNDKKSEMVSNKENKQKEQQNSQSIIKKEKKKTNADVQYKYEYMSGKLDELIKFYSCYYEDIPQSEKINFNIQSNLLDMLKGTFPQIIKITNNDSLIALAIISYIEPLKISIKHFSTHNEDTFSDILNNLLSHLNQTFSFQEIYIELYYEHKEDGSFVLNKNYEQILTKDIKFKWVNMENSDNQRKIKYKIINKNYKGNKDSLINIQTMSLILLRNVEKETNEENPQVDNKNDNEKDSLDDENIQSIVTKKILNKEEEGINIFPLMSLFCEMMYDGEYNIESESMRYMNMEVMKDISSDIIHNFIKTDNTSISKYLIDNKSDFQTEKITLFKYNQKDDFNCGSLLNMSISFDNVSSVKIRNQLYNRISFEHIPILSLPSGEIFYLLKTQSEKISLIVYEYINNDKMKINDFFNKQKENSSTLNEYFNEIYPEMNQVESNKKNIFIPQFELKENVEYKEPKAVSEYTVDTKEQLSYNINNLQQISKVLMRIDPKVNSNYINFEIKEDEDIIIKKDFLIAILNFDALSELEVPSIASFLIKIAS